MIVGNPRLPVLSLRKRRLYEWQTEEMRWARDLIELSTNNLSFNNSKNQHRKAYRARQRFPKSSHRKPQNAYMVLNPAHFRKRAKSRICLLCGDKKIALLHSSIDCC